MSTTDIKILLNTFDKLLNYNLKTKIHELIVQSVKDLVDKDLTIDEIDALNNGRKIECIKMVRERLNIPLIDAKNHVEKHMGPYWIPKE